MKVKTETILIDTTGIRWNREYWIRVREGSCWSLKTCESDPDAARRTARKYVHLGDVKIEEQLTRTLEILPCAPICT